ncbi:hypothetical protein C8Q72DRAFT_881377 [Fomitopsis betulina]|nr:hypothetical protein C8Q72DRAFT_881377 [Fomitopsis betulina]
MPERIELFLSTAITASIHLGLGDATGRAITDFLGHFKAYAPLPALYLTYSLCVWLSILASCVSLRRRLLGPCRTQRKSPRKKNKPVYYPQGYVENTTDPHLKPTEPTPAPQMRKVPSACTIKGERARHLREIHGGSQPSRAPVYSIYSNIGLLWDSQYPKVSGIISNSILTNKGNPSQPAVDPFHSQELSVSISGQSQVSGQLQPHKYRVSPGLYSSSSPVTCVRGAYDAEFSRWRQGEAKREKLCMERGIPYVEIPFDPTGSKARAAQANKPLIVAVEEPSATAVESTSEHTVWKPSAATVRPAESVVSSHPAVGAAQASKLKGSVVEKVKVKKARACAFLGRQVETMSLINTSVRCAKAKEASPKRKLRSARRSFEPKPIKHTFNPMDVDYSDDSMTHCGYDSNDSMDVDWSGDSMEVDPHSMVDEITELMSRCSISTRTM